MGAPRMKHLPIQIKIFALLCMRALSKPPRTATVRQTLARHGQRLHWNPDGRRVEIVSR